MFSHKNYLVIGGGSADLLSLIKGGHEVANLEISFEQGISDDGKVQTEVVGGAIHLVLPKLPGDDLILWGVKSKEYRDGMIVSLDDENLPVSKIIFKRAACVGFQIAYKRAGSAYSSTMMTIQAKDLTIGKTVLKNNRWVEED